MQQNCLPAGGAYDAPLNHLVGWEEDAPPHSCPPRCLQPLDLDTFSALLIILLQYKFLATRPYATHPLSKNSGYEDIEPPIYLSKCLASQDTSI